MAAVVPIDLALGGIPGAAAAYLVTGPEPVLVDPGPPESVDRVRRALVGLGVPVEELRGLLVTHAHRESAGAAGILAREVPGLPVVAGEEAARRLVAPEEIPADGPEPASTSDDPREAGMDLVPVPTEALREWTEGDGEPVSGVRPVATPGHAPGHLAYAVEASDVLLVGDALGVVLTPDSPTHPSAPPGEVDLEAWRRTLSNLREMAPGWVAVARFGIHDDAPGRVAALEEALDRLEERVARAVSQGQEDNDQTRFREQTLKAQGEHLPEARADGFFRHFDPCRDWEGVRRALDPEEREPS